MINKIQYENKVAIQNDETIPLKNKVTDEDMNEIKSVVNNNADEVESLEEQVNENTENISTLQTTSEENTSDISALKEENADLKEQLKDRQNNELKGTVSETEIDLTDSADSRVNEIGLSGNSDQKTTTGKNKLKITKFDNETTSKTSNGVTATINNDGTVTLNGTATANIDFYFLAVNIEGTSNKLVFNSMSGSFTGNTYAYAYDNNYNSGVSINISSKGDYENQLSNNVNYTRFEIYVKNQNVYSNAKFGLMVVSNTETNITYEQYTGRTSKS